MRISDVRCNALLFKMQFLGRLNPAPVLKTSQKLQLEFVDFK